MSLFSVGGNAGFAAGPLFVTAVLAATSSRGTLILAVPAVITGVTVYIVLRRSGHRAACGQPGVRWAGDRDDWRGFALLTSAVIVRPIFFFGLSSLLALYVGNGLGGGRKLGEAALTAMLVAVPRGHALIDRELCLPRSWAGDRVRCKAAGIAGRVRFATKPRLARRMITRALDAGTPAAWIAGDEVYGTDPGLRCDLERRRAGYVLAVACSHRIAAGAGASRADALAAALPRSRLAAVLRRPRRQGPPLL